MIVEVSSDYFLVLPSCKEPLEKIMIFFGIFPNDLRVDFNLITQVLFTYLLLNVIVRNHNLFVH